MYGKTSCVMHNLVGNKIVDHSDVVGAWPVGAAPTTSSFSTEHLTSIDWAKTTARRDEKLLCFVIWCDLYQRFDGVITTEHGKETHKLILTLPGQHGRRCADDSFKRMFMNKKFSFVFRFEFYWSLFSVVQLTIIKHCIQIDCIHAEITDL